MFQLLKWKRFVRINMLRYITTCQAGSTLYQVTKYCTQQDTIDKHTSQIWKKNKEIFYGILTKMCFTKLAINRKLSNLQPILLHLRWGYQSTSLYINTIFLHEWGNYNKNFKSDFLQKKARKILLLSREIMDIQSMWGSSLNILFWYTFMLRLSIIWARTKLSRYFSHRYIQY